MKTNLVIPSRSIWSFAGLMVVGIFTRFQIERYIKPGFQAIKSINAQTFDNTVISLVLVPIIAFVLAMSVLLLSINIFKNVTDLEKDLPVYIIFGLILGLIIGITVGLAIGLINGIIFYVGFIGILCGLMRGFLFGLTFALMAGLVLAMVFLIPPASVENGIKTNMG
jgi:uncharacterized protein YacL